MNYLANRQVLKDPLRTISKYQRELDQLNLDLINSYQHLIKIKANIGLLANKLDTLSPQKLLAEVML